MENKSSSDLLPTTSKTEIIQTVTPGSSVYLLSESVAISFLPPKRIWHWKDTRITTQSPLVQQPDAAMQPTQGARCWTRRRDVWNRDYGRALAAERATFCRFKKKKYETVNAASTRHIFISRFRRFYFLDCWGFFSGQTGTRSCILLKSLIDQ